MGRGLARRQGAAWAVGFLVTVLLAPRVDAQEADPRFFLDLEAGPVWYRYEETGRREFEGLRTEWAELAFRVGTEAHFRTFVWDLVSLLRFSFLTSLEDTETNNIGASATELRVPYFFQLQPGLAQEWHPHTTLTLVPEVAWDLVWYLQSRDLEGSSGQVDETVFWHGPAVGLQAAFALTEAWVFELGYQHSFLIDVRASNSFAESLGFGSLTTDGQRDNFMIGIVRKIASNTFARLGYRFDLVRIDASDTAVRNVEGPDGFQTFRVQFPENEHVLHGADLGFEIVF